MVHPLTAGAAGGVALVAAEAEGAVTLSLAGVGLMLANRDRMERSSVPVDVHFWRTLESRRTSAPKRPTLS